MDTLSSISSTTIQNSGFAQAQPPKAVAPETEATSHTNAAPESKTTQTKLPEHEAVQKVTDAAKNINEFFQMSKRSLEFNVDKTSGHVVMQIVDSHTHELISQIPGEDAIKLAKRLDEVTGLLFKARA